MLIEIKDQAIINKDHSIVEKMEARVMAKVAMNQIETSFEAERQAFFGQGFGFGKFVIMDSKSEPWAPNPNPKPPKKS